MQAAKTILVRSGSMCFPITRTPRKLDVVNADAGEMPVIRSG